MLSLLEEIRQEAALWNPFFLTRKLEDMRERVAGLPESVSAPERLSLQLRLAYEEFRLGSVESAIQQLSKLQEDLPAEAVVPRSQVAFYLGLAYLRLGERQNCVAQHTGESCILPIRGGGVHRSQENSRRAIEQFRTVLALMPPKSMEHVAVRWLTNVAYMTVGEYSQGVPTAIRITRGGLESDGGVPRLSNVAPHLGLDVVDWAGGAVVEDLTGDGLLDVLTSSWVPFTNLRFFVNQGDGKFVEATERAGLLGLTGGLNLVHADYDNDGDADVLVLRGAWLGRNGQHPNSLLRNSGDGSFTDVTFEAGLGDSHRPTQTAAWGDYDNDGDLDLYVGNEGEGEEFPGQLYRNNGDGTFVDVARQAGVENFRYAKSVVWGDYDGDRYPDLYVSNYQEMNRLYHNNRDGTFTDVAAELGVTEPRASFPSWFWDFDNDGTLDIYCASFPYAAGAGLQNLFAVVAGYLGLESGAERPRLYRGDGRGGFQEVGLERHLGEITMPMAANFGDLDNDGFLDLYLGTGYPEYDGLVPNVLYRNAGGERFHDVTIAAGVGHLQKGHGIAFADLDNDGDQDLFAQMGGFYPEDDFANALFENPGVGNHWLKVRLVGTESNRSAIGARIHAEIVDRGARRSLYRWVGTGGSFGANPLVEHLGLGSAARVEVLEVYWPTSDTAQVFREVAADRFIEIVEGSSEYRELIHPRIRLGGHN